MTIKHRHLLTMLAVAACAFTQTGAHAAASGEPIAVGASLELSGAAADVANDALQGARYAVEVINAANGVLGRPVTLMVQDNGTNAQKAVTQAGAMVKEGAKMLLVGSSGSAIAVSKAVAAKDKIPTCAGTSQADDLTIKDFHPYIYTMSPNSYMIMRSVAAYLAKQPYKTYAIVAPDYAAGRIGVNRFKDFMKEFNPKVEFVVEEFPKFGASDFTPAINKVLAAKPDYVFTMLFGNDLVTFSKQARAVDFFKQVKGRFSALYDGNTLKTIGDNAPFDTDGFQSAPANVMRKASPEGKAFVDAYKVKYGRYPADWAILAYDCVSVWAQAANAAKSVEADAVMSAIESQTFKSPRGEFRIGKFDHQADVSVYIGKVMQNSEFGQPVVEPKEIVPASTSRPSEQMLQKMRAAN